MDSFAQVEADTASDQATVSSAAVDLKAIDIQRDALSSELQQAEAAALLATRWDEYREAVAVHNDEVAEILAELSEVIEVDAVAPQLSLADARDEASALLDEVRESKAETRYCPPPGPQGHRTCLRTRQRCVRRVSGL